MSETKKGKYAEGFNDWLTKFFRELVKMYPQNQDFKNIKNQLLVMSQSPKYELPIQYFEQYLSPYRQHLRNKDEKFFLSFDLKGTGIEYFEYIKELWKISNNETKQVMWKYFNIFDKLSEKYHSI